MENPTAHFLPSTPRSAFCVQALVAGSYSQRSLKGNKFSSRPVPRYPLLPMENPVAPYLAPPRKSAFCVQVSCPLLLVKPAATRIARSNVCVFILFGLLGLLNYLITLSFFISSIETVGGISPFLILPITSAATLLASSFVINPSLPGSAGTLVW